MLYETECLRVIADRGVATLWLDFPGPLPNLWNAERLLELDDALQAVLPESAVKTLIIRSAKQAGFCAGFNIDSLTVLQSENDAREFAALGQLIFNRIANAECLSVAFIHGPCIGPGFELALACDYRLAVATANSAFGFGDTSTCWGGLTRLTRIAGASRAVEMLLKNESVTAREAVKLGFVDHAFCERRANIELRTFLDQQRRKPRRWHTPLDGWAARRVVGAYRQSESEPAWNVIPAAATSIDAGLRTERAAFADTLQSPRGQSTLHLALTRQRLNCIDGLMPSPCQVAVIGPVEPVADLLAEVAIRGGTVHLLECDEITADVSVLRDAIATARHIGRLTPLEAEHAGKRIAAMSRTSERGGTDAVFVTLKTAAAMEAAETAVGPATPILCTSDRHAMAMFASRLQRLFGIAIHESMAEIIRPTNADAASLFAIRKLLGTHGITPLIVGDRRGSLVNRVCTAYWDEAVQLVADGVPIAAVDAAARTLGATVGPLELMDGLGLPTVASQVPAVKPLLAAGIHGRPDDEGFYRLEADRHAGPNAAAEAALIPSLAGILSSRDLADTSLHAVERLRWRIVNAAAAALAGDDYVSPDEVDFAVVHGVGLLADNGGPLRMADRIGLVESVERLGKLAADYGERFKPHAELARRALAEEPFESVGPSEWQPLKRSA